MREITDLAEIKRILAQILNSVAKYCDEHHLRYYLAFGTLLGAVRHNGFIPWDDDVDIMMPREDYEKFVASFSAERYKISEVKTDREYYYPFAKVYDSATLMQENLNEKSNFGLYVDVFPMDGVPDGHRFHQKLLVFLQKALKNKYTLLERKRSKIKQFLLPMTKALLKPVKIHDIARLIDRLSARYSYAQNENVGVSVWGYYYLAYKKSDIEPGASLRFEDGTYSVPGNYDAILTKTYGDYMKLPPPEKRTVKHGYHAYYID